MSLLTEKPPKLMGNIATGSHFIVIHECDVGLGFKIGFRLWIEKASPQEIVLGYRFRLEGMEHDAASITKIREMFPDAKWQGGGSLHLSIFGGVEIPIGITNGGLILDVLKLNKIDGFLFNHISDQLKDHDLGFTREEWAEFFYNYVRLLLAPSKQLPESIPVMLTNAHVKVMSLMNGGLFAPVTPETNASDVGL